MKNIVMVQHPGNPRNFLFEVPVGITLRTGQDVYVKTMYGEACGICSTDNQIVPDETLAFICKVTGAYLPLKSVIGTVHKFADEIPF